VKDGEYCLPAPGPILIYKEGEGFPEFDQKRAKLYMNKVTQKIKEEILNLFESWDRLKV
jgi:hypothetical protein